MNPTVLQLSTSPSIVIMFTELLSDSVQVIVQVDAVSVDRLRVVLWLVGTLKTKIDIKVTFNV